MRGPEGYPETVTQQAVRREAASVISDARGKDLVIKELPEEKDVDAEEPRIGVFVATAESTSAVS